MLAREDAPGDKRLVAYVIPRAPSGAEAAISSNELRAHLHAVLPDYMVPSAFVVLQRFPLTTNGKLDRRALAAPDAAAYAKQTYQAPQGRIERALAQIWEELLQVQRVGREDNFFALGGHSLLGTKMIAEVAKKISQPSPGVTVFKHPTIRQMARAMEQAPANCPPLVARLPDDRIPLTLAQQHWWNMLDLARRRSRRSVFTAARVSGSLSIESLRRSFDALVRRHESLRTRIVTLDSVQHQVVDDPGNFDLEILTLSRVPLRTREAGAKSLVGMLLMEPIDVATGPLFAAKLLKLGETEHVLVVAMDHLISDAASVGILLRDLWAMYTKIVRELPFSLPSMPVQFADYAVWQQKAGRSSSAETAAYWNNRFAGAPRVKLFEPEVQAQVNNPKVLKFPLRLEEALSARLREFSCQERTTLAMTVLCVYTALIFRWCNKSDIVVSFQTTGRDLPEVQNTIGYFGTALFLRMVLHEEDSFLELLRRVIDEYGAAREHDDYGKTAAQIPQPEFVRNAAFNWFPREFHLHPWAFTAFAENTEGDIRVRPFTSDVSPLDDVGDAVEWDLEPALLLADSNDGVAGIIT